MPTLPPVLPFAYLSVAGRVPLGIDDDNAVGGGEGNAQTPGLRGEKKGKVLAPLGVEGVNTPLPLRRL